MNAERKSIHGILPNTDLSYYAFFISQGKKDCRSNNSANPHTKCVKKMSNLF